MGRALVIARLVLVAVGLLVALLGRPGLPLGKLPGESVSVSSAPLGSPKQSFRTRTPRSCPGDV
jgi:hypothetical protein